MNRQYIGARYVPKFSDLNGGVWDNSYSYEALTIVKYGMDFYTSKKPVPVGALITDSTYWVKTGDYNGAIAGLQEEIDGIETVVNFKKRYQNKKFVIYGDSLSSQSLSDDWVTPFRTLVESIGGSVTNHAVAGNAAAAQATAAAADTNVYDVAIIWVGINDAVTSRPFGALSGSNNFNNDYLTLINNIKAVSPNCDIFCFGLTYTGNYTFVGNSVYFYNQCIEDIATFRGCVFKTMLGLPHNNFGDNSATVDGTHFTENYSKTVIFSRIVKGLTNPVAETNPSIMLIADNLMKAADGVTVHSRTCWVDINQGILHIRMLLAPNGNTTVLTSDILPNSARNSDNVYGYSQSYKYGYLHSTKTVVFPAEPNVDVDISLDIPLDYKLTVYMS